MDIKKIRIVQERVRRKLIEAERYQQLGDQVLKNVLNGNVKTVSKTEVNDGEQKNRCL